MDKDYQKNFIKKGDPNFVYDKKVDYSKVAKVEASWDDDEDEDDIEEEVYSEYSEENYSDQF